MSSHQAAAAPTPWRRARIFLEVVVVFLGGTLIARALITGLGIRGSKEVIGQVTTERFDAVGVAIPLAARWTIVLVCAFIAGRWIGRHRLPDYGVTLAGRSAGWHLRAGIVVLAFSAWPALLVMLARSYFGLKGGPAQWDVFDSASWWRWDFWAFMLASSILLPPLFEEAFFRGYALTRMMTVFRPVTAAVIIAVLFMLAHTQYLDGSLIGALMFLSGLWQISLFGLARIETGSLLAPMTAHAIINVPMTPVARAVLLTVLVPVALLGLRRVRRRREGIGR